MYEAVELTYSQLSDFFISFQQYLSSIKSQGGYFTLNISYTPNQREGGSWKELAEAHLRERVRNPHDYRALSIELEGMKNAGYDWRQEFNYSVSDLTKFLNDLFGVHDLKFRTLWNRLEDISDKHLYQIQDSTENWRRLSSEMVSNGRQ